MTLEERKEELREQLHYSIDNYIPWSDLDDKRFKIVCNDNTKYENDYLGNRYIKGKKHGIIVIEW